MLAKVVDLIKKEPTTFLIAKMWRFSAGNRGKIVVFTFLLLCSNLVMLLGPYIFSRILNEIQSNGIQSGNIVKLLVLVSAIILTTILFWIFHGVGRVMERKVSFQTRQAYREYLFNGVVSLGLSWHGARDSGDTIDKINKATDGLYRFADHSFLITRIIVSVIGTVSILYTFNPYISLFALPFIILSFFVLFQFDRRLVVQYKKLNLLNNKISAKIFDALSNITSIIILDVREPIEKNMRLATLAPKPLYDKNVFLNEWKWFTGSVFFDLLLALPLAFYICYIYKNNIPVQIGTISALYLYLSKLSDVFFAFGGIYEDIIVEKTSVQNADALEESFNTASQKRVKAPKWNTLSLTDIAFAYEDAGSDTLHLNNVSLKVNKGEKIACIGESGSGKTTFLKVLHGLYPSAHALISFDDGKKSSTNFLNRDLHTMLVPQEPELFSSTVEENITFGVDYAQNEIDTAVELAQFNEVIDQLPKGYQSVINEKGVNLSGGQKQRLALARALLFAKDKEIILLDESTSSVDPKNEAKIYENIFSAFEGKTVIASIHKMNLLKYFDRIIIFEKGEIKDEGTFNELLERNAEFKKGWESFVTASE